MFWFLRSWLSKKGATNIFHWLFGFSEVEGSDSLQTADRSFLLSRTTFLASVEENLAIILFFSRRTWVRSSILKSLSKPRTAGQIWELNLFVKTSLMREADPFGMSPEMTKDKDSFFLGEKLFFTGNEASAMAQPWVKGELTLDSTMSAHFWCTGVERFSDSLFVVVESSSEMHSFLLAAVKCCDAEGNSSRFASSFVWFGICTSRDGRKGTGSSFV